jgi:Homeodomain-like domain
MRLRLHRPEEEVLWLRGKAYLQDLRGRALAAADDGDPVGRIATLLRVSVSYVSKVLSRRQQRWLAKFGQADKWNFCLKAARMGVGGRWCTWPVRGW